MLRRLRNLESWNVNSSDGHDLGSIQDCYFDDEKWTVRYVVIKTGNWLTGRSVLISPWSVNRVQWETSRLQVDLTQEQIKGAPAADLARPISRQWEANFSSYYGVPYYWPGPAVWGVGPTPYAARTAPQTSPPRDYSPEEQHLRSAKEVAGYHVHVRDGEIGHVEDFLVDDESWTIRYVTVDTSNWIGGRTVLFAPEWTEHIDWTAQRMHVDATRRDIESGPEYRPGVETDQRYREQLAESYRRPVRPI